MSKHVRFSCFSCWISQFVIIKITQECPYKAFCPSENFVLNIATFTIYLISKCIWNVSLIYLFSDCYFKLLYLFLGLKYFFYRIESDIILDQFITLLFQFYWLSFTFSNDSINRLDSHLELYPRHLALTLFSELDCQLSVTGLL